MSLSLVLLAYNEAENLEVLLPKIKRRVNECDKDHEILVVDTALPMDNTEEVCRKYGARYVNQEGSGFGDAFRSAIKYAEKDIFMIMDSDGSHPTKLIPALYDKFASGGYDVVVGSRYCKGAKSRDAFTSRVMSHILNFIYRIVIGVKATDISTDFRVYHTDRLKEVSLKCVNYDVLEEVLLKLRLQKPDRKLVIGEVPISFRKRMYGESKRRLIPFVISYMKTVFYLLKLRAEDARSRRKPGAD